MKQKSKTPVRVAITGAAGQIGYQLAFRIASGQLFGADQPIDEILFDPFASPFNPAPPESEDHHDDERPQSTGSAAPSIDNGVPADFRAAVADYERQVLRRALERAQFKQTVAAKILGLSYHQFRSLLRKHGLAKQALENGE